MFLFKNLASQCFAYIALHLQHMQPDRVLLPRCFLCKSRNRATTVGSKYGCRRQRAVYFEKGKRRHFWRVAASSLSDLSPPRSFSPRSHRRFFTNFLSELRCRPAFCDPIFFLSMSSVPTFDLPARAEGAPPRLNEPICFRCAKSMHELGPGSCDVTELRKCSRCARSHKPCDPVLDDDSTVFRSANTVLGSHHCESHHHTTVGLKRQRVSNDSDFQSRA